MHDFTELVPVAAALDAAGIDHKGINFEDVYSNLLCVPGLKDARQQVEDAVYRYFAALRLPDRATIYDALVLSLRAKDVVATFNWDPFLVQAIQRSKGVTPSLPRLLFLHGNVAHGYCPTDAISGPHGGACSRCHEAFIPERLLYPVRTKNYSADSSIAAAWAALRTVLQDGLLITIFGYGAPASDVDAIQLMSNAWGPPDSREFEEVEIIDIRPEPDLIETWDRFIHTHHYECHTDIAASFLFNHPRRSVEAFVSETIMAQMIENNPIPALGDLAALHEWFAPLVAAESAAGA